MCEINNSGHNYRVIALVIFMIFFHFIYTLLFIGLILTRNYIALLYKLYSYNIVKYRILRNGAEFCIYIFHRRIIKCEGGEDYGIHFWCNETFVRILEFGFVFELCLLHVHRFISVMGIGVFDFKDHINPINFNCESTRLMD